MHISEMVSTRRNTYDPNPDSEHNSSSTLSARRKRWAALLRDKHYQPLIAEVLAQELPKYTTSILDLHETLASTMRECVLILASAPLIFAAAVEGTLAQHFPVDVDLQREYQVIHERAHVQPSIYIHLLADGNGVAPTAEQYLVVRDTILKYLNPGIEQEAMAWQIDNLTPPVVPRSATGLGYRKYLWTKKRSTAHIETLQRFCTGILNRYNETPLSERDQPLAFPPGECGYSINSHVRLAQHRNRRSSNYIMNIVEDICGFLHNTRSFDQRFTMHPYIIYLIFRPGQAAIAEIFCSGLLQVWIDDGGGMNACPAGRSVASARRLSLLQWAEHERWVKGNTGLKGNLNVQRSRLEGDVWMMGKGEEKMMGEVWREALESSDSGDDEQDLDYVDDELGERFGAMVWIPEVQLDFGRLVLVDGSCRRSEFGPLADFRWFREALFDKDVKPC